MNESGRYTCQVADVTTEPTGVLRGDINGDGDVTINDLLAMRQYLAGNITLTDSQMQAADLNKDNDVTINDLLAMRQYLAGNISSLD